MSASVLSFRVRPWLRRLGGLLALFLLTIAVAVLFPMPADALSGAVVFRAVTPFATLDSNNAIASGPHAMYIQVNVTNTSGTTFTNLLATFNGFTSTAVASLNTGESALRYIGTLAPGAVAKLYW